MNTNPMSDDAVDELLRQHFRSVMPAEFFPPVDRPNEPVDRALRAYFTQVMPDRFPAPSGMISKTPRVPDRTMVHGRLAMLASVAAVALLGWLVLGRLPVVERFRPEARPDNGSATKQPLPRAPLR
jgi:hypothetical protein